MITIYLTMEGKKQLTKQLPGQGTYWNIHAYDLTIYEHRPGFTKAFECHNLQGLMKRLFFEASGLGTLERLSDMGEKCMHRYTINYLSLMLGTLVFRPEPPIPF